MIFPKICTLGLLRNSTINEHVKTIKTENKEQEIINIACLLYVWTKAFGYFVQKDVFQISQSHTDPNGTGNTIYEQNGNEASS